MSSKTAGNPVGIRPLEVDKSHKLPIAVTELSDWLSYLLGAPGGFVTVTNDAYDNPASGQGGRGGMMGMMGMLNVQTFFSLASHKA